VDGPLPVAQGVERQEMMRWRSGPAHQLLVVGRKVLAVVEELALVLLVLLVLLVKVELVEMVQLPLVVVVVVDTMEEVGEEETILLAAAAAAVQDILNQHLLPQVQLKEAVRRQELMAAQL